MIKSVVGDSDAALTSCRRALELSETGVMGLWIWSKFVGDQVAGGGQLSGLGVMGFGGGWGIQLLSSSQMSGRGRIGHAVRRDHSRLRVYQATPALPVALLPGLQLGYIANPIWRCCRRSPCLRRCEQCLPIDSKYLAARRPARCRIFAFKYSAIDPKLYQVISSSHVAPSASETYFRA